MEEGEDVGVDVPLGIGSTAAWLEVAGIGDVAKVAECLALGLGFFAGY